MIDENKFEFKEIKDELSDFNKKEILDLVRGETNQSILAQLSDKIIFDYLNIVQKSHFLKLFVLQLNNEILAYAITSKEPKYLISEFSNLKIKIFLSLFIKFKVITLFNILLSVLKLDLILLKKDNVKKVNESLNLNLIAVTNKLQSKGIGSFFLKKIISKYKEDKKINYTICETYDHRALKFYINKCGFKIIGKKIRVPRNLFILEYDMR